MVRYGLLAVMLSATVVAADVLRYGFPSQQINEKNEGNHWAVLVAGSNTWGNYRHQADICHAYHVLIEHGFSPDRIITLMYDDIANNEFNPDKGVIINHPNGKNVYPGVKINYRESDVTPENFLAVLRGADTEVKGGTGRVLKSGPNDHVFVNFADHGAPGILGFPEGMLSSSDFMDTINYMNQNNMYNKMVLYIEACESGSMFKGLLPDNIDVYATTAANSHESSYACYQDERLDTYLGDVYSVNWMEDSDKEDLKKETLHKQFKIVRNETTTSHVKQFGDVSISQDDVSEYQGGVKYMQPEPQILPPVPFDAIPSEDVPVAILKSRLEKARTEHEREMIQEHIDWHNAVEKRVQNLMSHIVHLATDGEAHMTEMMLTHRIELNNRQCYEPAVKIFNKECMKLPQNDYALRRLYILVNLCESGIPTETIHASIRKACHGTVRM